ncbi:hypothetical protein IGI04_035946 [Brassica rapa subsp. trilocularis]|uniref:Uncharacterized protein n=1 Tax=Brassica rapa subsp. trilocularis TaxID=1813537 RepID=A0ABQ7LFE4_BRACM|nr:hypothetical protein IGI04_035946 [Brassica rapa subsp. trilocularis]
MSVAVRVCPCVSVSTHRTSVAVHQHPHDVRGCLWLSISTHISTLVLGLSTLTLPLDCLGDFGPLRLSVQYTQDVSVCPSAHTGRPWLFVCVRQDTIDHADLPVDCSGDFGPRGLSVQYTQDVCGCQPAHTERLWLSVRTHRTSVAVRVCPSVAVYQYTYQHIVLGLSTLTLPVECSGDFGPLGLSVQYTQNVRGCPSAHTGHQCVSVSTLMTTLTLPVDCSGDLGPRGLSVQYKQEVRGCPSAHIGRQWVSVSSHRTLVAVRVCLCVSVSTHRTSVAVHQYTYQHVGPWIQHADPSHGLFGTLTLPVDSSGEFGSRGLSVKYTQDVCGCQPAHKGRSWLSVSTHRTSVAVRVCPCVSVSTHRTSMAVHQYTYQHVVPWTQLADPSRGLFRTSMGVQDVSVCLSAHTGRPWLSVSTHMTSVAVHVCPCVSVSTHRTFVAVHQYTYQHAGPTTQHAGPSSGLFGTQRTSVGVRQHTQDVPVCPSAHTGRMWLFVRFCVCPCVSVSTHRTSVAVRVCLLAHTGRPWLSISTHISTLVLRLSTLALPVDCLGDFGPRGLSVQYTQDVCGCPSAHTGRPWVSISTHRTSVCVCQHTKDVCGCPSAHTGRPRVSVSTHRTYVAFRACLCVSVCVRQHTQDVRGCPSVHISARWSFDSARWPFRWTVWVILAHVGCLFSTHRTSVGVRQHTEDVSGCPSAHTERQWLSGCVCVCPSAHTGRLWLSVAVRQHPHGVRGCPCVSVCVRVCVSAHTGLPLLSISTHISTLVLGLSTLTLPLDCLGDFRPLGLSVQYTQDVRGCPSAHTGRQCVSVSTHTTSMAVRHADLPVDCSGDFGPHGVFVQYTQDHTQDVRSCPWLPVSTHRTSVAVRVCLWVSASTHMTSVAVHQYTYQHAGPLSQNAGPSRGLFGPWLSASTHRTSVCICQHTQDIRVCPCVSVSTHRTSVAVHQYTDQHAGLWTQHAGPSRGLFGTSVAVRVCLCVFVCFRQHTHDVCGCPSVNISACWSLDSARWPFPWTFLGYFGPRWLSVQYTQDVRGCPPAHTGRPWLSMAVRQHTHDVRGCPCVSVCVRQHTQDVCGCPSAHTGPHTGRPWLSNSTHITTMVLGLSTLALPVDCLVDFGPRGQSVQYTQDVRGCPPAHPRTSVAVRQRTQDVRGCTCVSVCVRQHTQDVRGCPSVHISARWSFDSARWPFPWTVWVILAHVGYLFSTHRTSVGVRQHTEDVSGCPSAHTGRQWLSGCVCVCPSAHTGRLWLSVSTHMTSVAVRVCPCVSVSTHRTSVAIHQYTYQHVGPWTQHADPSLGLTQRTSVGVRQHTLNVCGGPGVSVCVRQYTQDVRGLHTGRPWVSTSTHMTSVAVCQHTHDVRGCPCVSMCDCHHTQDVRGCPSVHISARWTSVGVHHHTQDVRSCLWLSVSTHMMSVAVRVYPCVSVSRHRTSVAVHQYTYQHAGPSTQHAGPSRGLFGTSVAVHQYTYQHAGPSTQHAGPSCGLFGTHRTSVAVRQHPHDVCGCPCVSVCVCQHTQDFRCCPSVHISALHTGRLWVSVSTHRTSVCVCQHTQDVHGCSCVSVRTQLTYVAVHQYTYHNVVSWTQHADLPVDCSGDFGPRGLSVQYTQDVCGCQPAHTERLWLSVSTHRTTLTLPVECSGDYGPLGLSVQYTQDVRGCPPPHTGRLWLSLAVRQYTHDVRGCPCVSVCVCQQTQDVRGCPSVHISAIGSFDSARWPFPWTVWVILALVDCLFSTHGTSVGVRQHTQDDVRGCPSVHISARWSFDSARWPFPWTVWVILAHVGYLFSTHRTSVGVRQHTEDVSGCPSAHTGRQWLSWCVYVCPSAHTGRLWLFVSTHMTSVAVRVCPCVSVSTHRTSVAVHQYTYQHVGPWTQHADPSLGLFGTLTFPWTARVILAHVGCLFSTHRTSVGVSQHTQNVCGCPSAHTGRQWLSVCVHPWLSISTHISTLVLGLSTLTLPVECSGDYGPLGLSVQYTQDVRGCPPPHTGRLWLSLAVRQYTHDVRGWDKEQDVRARHSLHISARGVFDSDDGHFRGCLGGFWPSWESVRKKRTTCTIRGSRVCPLCVCYVHTQDVPWRPSVHNTALWSFGLSTLALPWTVGDSAKWAICSVHKDSVGCPVQLHKDVRAVRQHNNADGSGWMVLCVVSTTDSGVSSVHISAVVLGLSTLTLPLDCLGDFGPLGLSVQYTQDVCGCPSAHTERQCVSVSTHRTTLTFPWTARVILAHVGCLFSTHRTSVGVSQHTQNVCGCPSAHTGRQWLSVCVHPWLSISTHISTLVLGLSKLTLPVECSGDYGPLGLSVQYTQDVRGCPPPHTGRPWLSLAVRQQTHDVRGCPCVSACVCQQTQDVRGCPSVHISARGSFDSARWPFPWTVWVILALVGCLFSTHGTSVGVRQHTQDVSGCLWLSVSTHRTSVAVCVCLSAHTGRLWLSVCVRLCQCVSVAVRDVRGCPSVHISARWSFDSARWPFPWTVWVILAHVGYLFSTHRTSVGVRQHTEDVSGCPSAHTGRQWLSWCVYVCPSAHTGRLWLFVSTHMTSVAVRVCPCVSVSTHRTSVAVHQYTYQHVGPWTQHADPSLGLFGTKLTYVAVHQYTYQNVVSWTQHADLPVDCSGDFGPRGLSVQYTQDVCGCQPAHTERLWLSVSTHRTSVAVRVCPSVAVHQYTYQHIGPWTPPADPPVECSGTLTLPVDCSGDLGPRGLSVHYTQDIRGCPTSVAVHQYTYQHVGPWIQHADPSHGLFGTLTLPVDSSGEFGSRGLSVKYTQDVCGCQPAHKGRSWLSVSTHRTSVAVRVCPCVSVSTHRTSMAVHQYTYQHVVPWTQLADPSRGLFRTSMGVQDVSVCLSAHTGRPWLSVSTHMTSVAVHVCPCVSVSTHRTFVAVHQYTYQHAGPTTQHAGPSSGLFGTQRTSVGVRQHTQDVPVCPSAHTGRMWLFVRFCVCPCVSVSTHRTSVAVRVCLLAHTGRPWLSISTHISTLVLRLSTLALPVDCLGDFGPRGLSVQYTQDVCGCPSAHTGRPWVSISTHRTSVCVCQHTKDVCGCPSAHTGRPRVSVSTHRTYVAFRACLCVSVCVRQHTQDVRGCPSVHISARWSFDSARWPFRWTVWVILAHVGCLFSTHRTSVGVRQHTEDVSGCPSAHTERQWLSGCVCVCPSAHTGRLWLSVAVRQHPHGVRGCPCVSVCVRVCVSAHTGLPLLSISTHISTLVLGLSTLTLPLDCLGDFRPLGLSVQYTQDVRGCPSAHTGRQCVSVSTHTTSMAVRVCPSGHN